jgi:hypothetical protein
MTRRFDGAAGAVGAVATAWFRVTNTVPTVNRAERDNVPVLACTV